MLGDGFAAIFVIALVLVKLLKLDKDKPSPLLPNRRDTTIILNQNNITSFILMWFLLDYDSIFLPIYF